MQVRVEVLKITLELALHSFLRTQSPAHPTEEKTELLQEMEAESSEQTALCLPEPRNASGTVILNILERNKNITQAKNECIPE